MSRESLGAEQGAQRVGRIGLSRCARQPQEGGVVRGEDGEVHTVEIAQPEHGVGQHLIGQDGGEQQVVVERVAIGTVGTRYGNDDFANRELLVGSGGSGNQPHHQRARDKQAKYSSHSIPLCLYGSDEPLSNCTRNTERLSGSDEPCRWIGCAGPLFYPEA